MSANLLKELLKREEMGLVRSQTDGDDLIIFNYTEECQFKKQWDEYTLMARGLILNKKGEIVARPFDKFFNLNEGVMPNEDPVPIEDLYREYGKPIIEDKADGSLGIVFWYYNKWNIATRGSFQSDQALHAQKFLHDLKIMIMFDSLSQDSTHLFEIIYPENRIVLDYGGEDTLYYLWSRHNKSGDYYKEGLVQHFFPKVEMFNDPLGTLPERENAEGYVLFFPDAPNNGLRIKIKFEEYIRLHRIMTGLTPKRVWEALMNGVEIDLMGVPEEFRDEVETFITRLKLQYMEYVEGVENLFEETDSQLSRKEKALLWQQHPKLTSMMFARLDGKPYDRLIWKQLEPKNENFIKKLNDDIDYIPEPGD